jgi:polysaccharide export outer membrane protein
LIVVVGLALLAGCTVSAGQDPSSERAASPAGPDGLRPGERVAVTVAGQPELSGTYELDRDGRFEMALLGAVDAYGLTEAGLEDRLVARLADGYLREPRVEVERAALRPFFILGDVARPGSYRYRAGMTVADAVAVAGGPLAPEQLAVTVTPAGRERETRRVALDANLRPGDIVELEASPG